MFSNLSQFGTIYNNIRIFIYSLLHGALGGGKMSSFLDKNMYKSSALARYGLLFSMSFVFLCIFSTSSFALVQTSFTLDTENPVFSFYENSLSSSYLPVNHTFSQSIYTYSNISIPNGTSVSGAQLWLIGHQSLAGENWDWTYSASQLPNETFYNWSESGNTRSSISSGILNMNGSSGYWNLNSQYRPDQFDNFTVEFRARISNSSSGQMIFSFHRGSEFAGGGSYNNFKGNAMEIYTDHVKFKDSANAPGDVYTHTDNYSLDATEWHTYRYTYLENGKVNTIYVDGKQVLQTSHMTCMNSNCGGQTFSEFKFGVSGGSALADMDYFQFTKGGASTVLIPKTPKNPNLRAGSTQVWSVSGFYAADNNSTGDFSSAINSYIGSCTYLNSSCQVPLRFYSEAEAILELNRLDVNLTYNHSGAISSVYIISLSNSFGSTANLEEAISFTSSPSLSLNITKFYVDGGTSSCSISGISGTVSTLNNRKVCSVNSSILLPSNGSLPNTTYLLTNHLSKSILNSSQELNRTSSISVQHASLSYLLNNSGSVNYSNISWSFSDSLNCTLCSGNLSSFNSGTSYTISANWSGDALDESYSAWQASASVVAGGSTSISRDISILNTGSTNFSNIAIPLAGRTGWNCTLSQNQTTLDSGNWSNISNIESCMKSNLVSLELGSEYTTSVSAPSDTLSVARNLSVVNSDSLLSYSVVISFTLSDAHNDSLNVSESGNNSSLNGVTHSSGVVTFTRNMDSNESLIFILRYQKDEPAQSSSAGGGGGGGGGGSFNSAPAQAPVSVEEQVNSSENLVSDNTSLSYSSDAETHKINIPVDAEQDNSNSWVSGLVVWSGAHKGVATMSIGGILMFLLISTYVMRTGLPELKIPRPLKFSRKISQDSVKPSKPNMSEITVSKEASSVMNMLNPRAKEILEFILQNDGKTTQAKIYHATGIPTTSLSRWVDTLERRGLIKTYKLGKLRKIELSESFPENN
jgi:hypothetical protein